MKRICLIAGDLNPNDLGGAEKHVVETLGYLANKGYEIEVIGGRRDEVKILFEKYPGIHVHTINYPAVQNLYSVSYIFFAIPTVLRFLKKNKIDLIWSKEVFPMGVIAAVAKRMTGLPLYMTTQNPYCYKEEMIIVARWLPKRLARWGQNLLTSLVSWVIKQADYVGAVSTYSQNLAYAMGAKRCDVTPNGIYLEKFPFKKRTKLGREVKLISTSSFIPRNGLDTLIKAVALLSKDKNYLLQLTSDGPLLVEYKNLAKKLSVGGRIKFLGMQKPEAIPKLLAASDIFIRPSRAEGFGVSFIESMAIGTPVVTCPSGGIVDFIKDGETGLLVEPNRPDQVARAIERLATSQGLYRKLVTKGREVVAQRYAWSKIANQIDGIWRKMLS